MGWIKYNMFHIGMSWALVLPEQDFSSRLQEERSLGVFWGGLWSLALKDEPKFYRFMKVTGRPDTGDSLYWTVHTQGCGNDRSFNLIWILCHSLTHTHPHTLLHHPLPLFWRIGIYAWNTTKSNGFPSHTFLSSFKTEVRNLKFGHKMIAVCSPYFKLTNSLYLNGSML